ncbi:MAG: hypothetical protein ABFD97_08490 [Syntrophobacter sp.]
MKKWTYALVVILCLALGTGLFWAVSGSCQVEKGAAGQQPAANPAGDKSTLQPAANTDANRDQKAAQAEDPRKAAEPAPAKKARGAFNPTEGC